MVKVKVTCGTTYVGCPSETVEFECFSKEEVDSDKFSTEILNAIFNKDFPHYFMEIETEEVDDDGEEENDEDEDE